MIQRINIQNLKYEIARLDRQIIFNLVQRFKYTELLNNLECNKNKTKNCYNFRLMLKQRKAWAINAGLNHFIVQKIAQYIIDYYLTEVRNIHE